MPAATGTQPTFEQQRSQALIAMGFTPTQALLLATTREGGAHVHCEEVKLMLAAGCRHDTALRILL